MRMKAQAALEYLGVTAFLLGIIIILSVFAYSTYFDAMKHRMLDDSVNAVSETVNQAYSLGKGTVLFVKITLPGGVTESLVNGRAVGFKFDASSGPSDYWNSVDANVSGTLPTSEGAHLIRVEYADSNVLVSEYTG